MVISINQIYINMKYDFKELIGLKDGTLQIEIVFSDAEGEVQETKRYPIWIGCGSFEDIENCNLLEKEIEIWNTIENYASPHFKYENIHITYGKDVAYYFDNFVPNSKLDYGLKMIIETKTLIYYKDNSVFKAIV